MIVATGCARSGLAGVVEMRGEEGTIDRNESSTNENRDLKPKTETEWEIKNIRLGVSTTARCILAAADTRFGAGIGVRR